ncbi:MAG: TRAP transporter TatT component family protein [Pyrinomonadaceae bacterium]
MELGLQDTIVRVDELYSKRQRIENIHASVKLLQLVAPGLSEYEINWRAGRAFFFLGQQAPEPATASLYYSHGIATCRQAARETGGRVEGHFWLGVNLALAAQAKRSFRGIQLALEARRELKRAVAIDETYHGAGPLRVLARLEHKIPSLLGGGKPLARRYYERAIAIAPENTVTRIYFAELLLEMGDRNRAREQLEFVMSVKGDPNWTFEIARDKDLASQMLNQFR